MLMEIPTVTVEDLERFHARHFPIASVPTQFFYHQDDEANVFAEHNDFEYDGLGYYEDGTERTLTDEQIAMFRHTEIQKIMRERRRQHDGADQQGSPLPHVPSLSPGSALQVARTTSTGPPSDEDTPMSMSSSDDGEVLDVPAPRQPQQWIAIGTKSKARNAKNRKKNRHNYRERKKQERRRRKQEGTAKEDDESDEWDPWHQATGPDAQKDDIVDLDY